MNSCPIQRGVVDILLTRSGYLFGEDVIFVLQCQCNLCVTMLGIITDLKLGDDAICCMVQSISGTSQISVDNLVSWIMLCPRRFPDTW